jgi:uncharacterized protein (DUF2225 family)
VKSDFNLEQAVVILESIVKENDSVGVFNYHLGEAYRKQGDKDNAIVYLNKALKNSLPESEVALKARQSLRLVD